MRKKYLREQWTFSHLLRPREMTFGDVKMNYLADCMRTCICAACGSDGGWSMCDGGEGVEQNRFYGAETWLRFPTMK